MRLTYCDKCADSIEPEDMVTYTFTKVIAIESLQAPSTVVKLTRVKLMILKSDQEVEPDLCMSCIVQAIQDALCPKVTKLTLPEKDHE